MLVFGPVPSRRLGRSLGVNNIPPKICSYACVYCQVGPTTHMGELRQVFHDPAEIVSEVAARLRRADEAGEQVDYVTFVPDGEPTLDRNLGREISGLRPLGRKVAVISNGSLIWDADVREELARADWVSLKVDTVNETTWRRINRPHRHFSLQKILDGARAFREEFGGQLVTETLLVDGVNDGEAGVTAVAEFLAELRPAKAYLSIPTRPPAESWVRPPADETLHRAYQRLAKRVEGVEFLIEYEGDEFASTGDAAGDLLAITAVHPMREDAVRLLLTRAGAGLEVADRLVADGKLLRMSYGGERFYVRRFGRTQRGG